MEIVADKFKKETTRNGAESIWPYYYGGTMGRLQRDGINRLRNVMKYSGMKKTICASIVSAGWKAGIGSLVGSSPYEISEADLIIIWGTNIVSTQINVVKHLKKAIKNRGSKLIVIDPYRNATSEMADEHICINPGTDGALAVAMMNVLYREKLIDTDYIKKYTDNPINLESHLSGRSPEWASEITGIPEKTIVRIAKEYGKTARSFIRVGFGLSRHRNGASTIHAISCLPSLTGKWKTKGGGAFFSNSGIYKLDTSVIEGLDVLDDNVRVLDMSQIGRILNGDKQALLNGPEVKAMLIQNTNPMVVAPEHQLVKKGFSREDLFVCVHEQFLTETALFADIVLPATTFLEHDDLYVGGGHSYLQLGPKAVNAFGESKSNHEVICELSKLLGAKHKGFEYSSRELIDITLRNSGYPGFNEMLELKWYDCMPSFEDSHFIFGFPNKDGKFHFSPSWKDQGFDSNLMPNLPDYLDNIDKTSELLPFKLVTAPAKSFLNSTFTETFSALKKEYRPEILIHSEVATKLQIKDGDIVFIGNDKGKIRIHVKIFDGLNKNVVIVESLWPNKYFIDGLGINTLTSADSVPPNGGAPFHDTAIWIKKIN